MMQTFRPRSTRRATCRAVALLCLTLCAPAVALAQANGAQIIKGHATIVNQNGVMTIVNSPGTIIDWQNFSIATGQTANFIQQYAASSVLNRIVGQNPSLILGTLQSNGHVYLINPNGIVFGKGSQVNVGGLVASTLGVSDADFQSGQLHFSAGAKAGDISSQGAITTPAGGRIYLVASNIDNSGVITSPQGEVVLAAGHSVALVDSSNPSVGVVLSNSGDHVVNLGQIIAEGGKVGIYAGLIEQGGLVSANSAYRTPAGDIVFASSGDTLLQGNSVTTATGASGGGSIEILGDRVGVLDQATVNASGNTGGGSVLVGGDFHGGNAQVQNAAATYVGAGASIAADAISSGNGGRVAVWSDTSTQMYGHLSAQGGAASGNGGMIEASSKGYLDFQGTVALTAAKGSKGTLLLDPSDITIGTAASTLTVPDGAPFVISDTTGANPESQLSAATLSTLLGSANVTVSTTSSATTATQGGTITVAAPVSWATTSSLTLEANQGIVLNAPITAPVGALLMTTTAGNIVQTLNTTAPATLTLSALSAQAPAGSVTLTEPTNVVTGAVSGVGAQGFSFASAGAIQVGSVGASTGISSASSVALNAASGDITQTAPIAAAGLSAVAQTGSVDLTSATNAVSTVAGSATGSGGFAIASTSSLIVGTVTGNTSTTSATTFGTSSQDGISSSSGAVSLTAANIDVADSSVGIIAVANPVMLNSSGAITTSNGFISGSSLTAIAQTGIGSLAAPLNTSVGLLQASSASGDIAVSNSGSATLQIADIANVGYGIQGSGSIYVASAGTLAVNAPVQAMGASGNVGLSAGITLNLNAPVSAPTDGGVVALVAQIGSISQIPTAGVSGQFLSASAPQGSVQLTATNNQVADLAGAANSYAGFSYTGAAGFTVGSVPGEGSIAAVDGITSTTGYNGIALQAGGSGAITVAAPINGGASLVTIDAPGAVAQGSGGLITAGSLGLTAGGSIGSSAAPLVTNVGTLNFTGGGDAYISSVGSALALGSSSAPGAVQIASAGSLSVGSATACGDCPPQVITGGSVTLVAQSDLTVNTGAQINATSGPIALYAGFTNPSGDASAPATLTVGGNLSAATSVDLWSGGAIAATGTSTPGATLHPNAMGVTLAQCIANPALPGCSGVLPTISQCTVTPSLPGCSVVLPTIAQCSSTPSLAGCSAVLPTLAQCSLSPTTPGCSVVLPTVAQCVATRSLAGCGVVLPSLASCEINPATPGCSVILPTIGQCVANTDTAGCTAVLPTLAQCVSTPTAAGCSVVLPSLASCMATPTEAGCSVVLPVVDPCTADPAAAGCVAVAPATLPPATPAAASADPALQQAIQYSSQVITSATPSILASNSYVIATNSDSGTLLNASSSSSGSSSTGNSSANNSSTASGGSSPGASSNGTKKLYCN